MDRPAVGADEANPGGTAVDGGGHGVIAVAEGREREAVEVVGRAAEHLLKCPGGGYDQAIAHVHHQGRDLPLLELRVEKRVHGLTS